MKKLKPGDAAPDFTARTHEGKLIRLSELRPRPVWLIFYRYASCPLCNLHFSKLLEREADFERAGLRMVAIFESPPEKVPQRISRRADPSIPLVCDPDKGIYALYDTDVRSSAAFHPAVAATLLKAMFYGFPQRKIEGELGQIPAHFLIGEGGIIERAHYGRHITDHLPFAEVENFLERRWRGGRVA